MTLEGRHVRYITGVLHVGPFHSVRLVLGIGIVLRMLVGLEDSNLSVSE